MKEENRPGKNADSTKEVVQTADNNEEVVQTADSNENADISEEEVQTADSVNHLCLSSCNLGLDRKEI